METDPLFVYQTLSNLKIRQLRQLARENGITVTKRTKNEIIGDLMRPGLVEKFDSNGGGRFYCNKSRSCRNRITEYHTTCDPVWTKKCLRNMKPEELEAVRSNAENCADQRAEYQVECCDGKVDEGHIGAIDKMAKLMKSCDDEAERRSTK